MKVKIFSTALSVVMLMGSMPIFNASAEETDVVYSYSQEDGTVVDVTQAELDEGHWDADALDETAPVVYEDFPADVSDYVNETAEQTIYVQYMKNVDEGDSAVLTVTDIDTEKTVLTDDLSDGEAVLEAVPIDTDYKFTIRETLDGETNEYTRVVMTGYADADMPEYVTSPSKNDETIILIGSVPNLLASRTILEDGTINYDIDMPRYEQVKACDFNTYVSGLDTNTMYHLYTNDGENRYKGFVTGGSSYVYTPSITVISWDEYINPQPSAVADVNVTADMVVHAPNRMMLYGYRDASFRITDSSEKTSNIRVGSYTMPDGSDNDESVVFTMNANQPYTWELWTAVGDKNDNGVYTGYENPKKIISKVVNSASQVTYSFVAYTMAKSVLGSSLGNTDGVRFYLVMYFHDSTDGVGYMTARCTRYGVDSDDDNKTGDDVSFNLMSNAYKSSLSKSSMTETKYTIKNPDDCDAFYINNEKQKRKYTIKLTNKYDKQDETYYDNGNEKYENRRGFYKALELVRIKISGDFIYTEPVNYVEVGRLLKGDNADKSVSVTCTISAARHYGFYVYSLSRNSKDDPYYLSFSY